MLGIASQRKIRIFRPRRKNAVGAEVHVEIGKLKLRRFQLVSQNGEAEQRILLQLTRDVKSVFIQSPPARRERTHQTDFHGPPLASKRASNAPPDEVWFDRGQQN